MIEDDYLTDDQMQALNELHIEYAKVHWIGYEYNRDKNPLIDLVMSTKPKLKERAHGVTCDQLILSGIVTSYHIMISIQRINYQNGHLSTICESQIVVVI